MPQIILGPDKHAPAVDGSVKSKAYSFLEKLSKNDSTSGSHIEPIKNSADPRVRTGRVDKFWRAVLFKLQGQAQDAAYVYLGVWPHDDAIVFAKKAKLQMNPVNGIPELIIDEPLQAKATTAATAPEGPSSERSEPTEPLLVQLGIDPAELTAELGLDPALVDLAMEATDVDALTEVAELGRGWQGVALIDLSAGKDIATVKETLGIEVDETPEPAAADDDEDSQLVRALRHPAARLQFAFIDDDQDLRRAIEDDDFDAWRVFLHPEQRRYAERPRNGAFRLSGGAGTGKTVVLLHRARHLARENPQARILLTTFNKTLADSLVQQLRLLDPDIPVAQKPGEPGVYVRGVDSAARSILQTYSDAAADAVSTVLGPRTSEIGTITDRNAWRDVIASDGASLASDLKSPLFFQAEYAMIVLPNRITTFAEYAKVRRSGRGVPLNRAGRSAVWDVISAYRLNAGIHGSIDFPEAAAIAAAALNATGSRPFDHVLVDEGQDLNPPQWQFLRSLVAEGPNDLFIAEDSHQRIYGQRVVLGRLGIAIVGRSQRLRLNYRTTAQNLRYAVSVLDGTDFVDIEDQPEEASDYRSARTGPKPRVVQASSASEEFDLTAQQLTGWLERTEAPETIGVLVRTEQAGEQVVRELEERGVESRFVQNRSVPAGRPVVMTMHRAKGMEFSKVLLFGVDSSSLPAPFVLKNLADADRDDLLQREKSLLYVAVTRARDELVIIWTGGRSELLPAPDSAEIAQA